MQEAAAGAAGVTRVGVTSAAAGVTGVMAQRALQAATHSSSVADVPCLAWVEFQVDTCRQLPGCWSSITTPGGAPQGGAAQHASDPGSSPAASQGQGEQQEGSLAWSNRLVLTAAPPWPLSLVLTQRHLEQYSQVFSVLLLLRRVLCRLQACWQALHTKGPAAAAAENNEDAGAQQRLQMRQARHWVHLGLHSMSGLLSQLHLQVQGVVQEQFVAEVRRQPLSVAAMREAHGRMAAAAAAACGLSQGPLGEMVGVGGGAAAGAVAAMVERVMRCWELTECVCMLAGGLNSSSSGGSSGVSGAGRWACKGGTWKALAEVGLQLEGELLQQA